MTLPTPLSVDADLRLAVEGHPVTITGRGRRVVVGVPSMRAAALLLRTGPFHRQRRSRLRTAQDLLHGAGLTAELQVRGVPLARLGADTRPGAVSRLLRLGRIEMRPARSAGSILARAARVGLPALLGLGLLYRFLRRDD